MPLQVPDARDGWKNAVMFVEEQRRGRRVVFASVTKFRGRLAGAGARPHAAVARLPHVLRWVWKRKADRRRGGHTNEARHLQITNR